MGVTTCSTRLVTMCSGGRGGESWRAPLCSALAPRPTRRLRACTKDSGPRTAASDSRRRPRPPGSGIGMWVAGSPGPGRWGLTWAVAEAPHTVSTREVRGWCRPNTWCCFRPRREPGSGRSSGDGSARGHRIRLRRIKSPHGTEPRPNPYPGCLRPNLSDVLGTPGPFFRPRSGHCSPGAQAECLRCAPRGLGRRRLRSGPRSVASNTASGTDPRPNPGSVRPLEATAFWAPPRCGLDASLWTIQSQPPAGTPKSDHVAKAARGMRPRWAMRRLRMQR